MRTAVKVFGFALGRLLQRAADAVLGDDDFLNLALADRCS